MSPAALLNRGMAIDLRVGESITLHPSVDARKIVITVEQKGGQRSRFRIQSDDEVRIELPRRVNLSAPAG